MYLMCLLCLVIGRMAIRRDMPLVLQERQLRHSQLRHYGCRQGFRRCPCDG